MLHATFQIQNHVCRRGLQFLLGSRRRVGPIPMHRVVSLDEKLYRTPSLAKYHEIPIIRPPPPAHNRK